MTLYKCKDCTHEENYTHKPSDCFVCGGLNVEILDDFFYQPTDSILDKLKKYSYSERIQSHNRENLDIFLL
jgi:hypothetical protein